METQHLKQKTEIFLRNNIKVFIKDIYGLLYFCYIKEIFDDWVIISPFKGNQAGERIRILWIDIDKLDEYREVGA